MSDPPDIRQVIQDKQLASLGDAFANFVYSLALTQSSGKPQAVKVSDRILAEAFRLAGLRKYLGSRVSRKDLANAAESLLFEAYRRKLLAIEEAVRIIASNSEGPEAGLADLLKMGAERVGRC